MKKLFWYKKYPRYIMNKNYLWYKINYIHFNNDCVYIDFAWLEKDKERNSKEFCFYTKNYNWCFYKYKDKLVKENSKFIFNNIKDFKNNLNYYLSLCICEF